MASGVVYVSNGRLLRKMGEAPASEIDSSFAQSIRQRAFEMNRRHAWKTQGRGAKFMGVSGAALWGGGESSEPQDLLISFTGCCRGASEGDFYYALQSPEISGVLLLKNEGVEQRLLHTADFRIGHIAAQPGTGRLAMSVRHRGSATIAVMDSDGRGFAEVTQGESVDESPHWSPNGDNRITFQSAGLARNQHGQYVGTGPFSIQMLDLDSGQMTCLAEDEKRDFLGPQLAADGTIYCIRRPYRLAQSRFRPLQMIEDILLFPFRLIYAFFQYLNIFTMMYTGKPLAKSGAARQQYADLQRMTVWGNLIEARKSTLKSGDEAPSLVPDSWELCRIVRGGAPEVLAKGVLSFDVEPDGAIVYSNGSAIFCRERSGQTSRLHRDVMIQQVIAAGERAAVSQP
jgi:hypothetical protein